MNNFVLIILLHYFLSDQLQLCQSQSTDSTGSRIQQNGYTIITTSTTLDPEIRFSNVSQSQSFLSKEKIMTSTSAIQNGNPRVKRNATHPHTTPRTRLTTTTDGHHGYFGKFNMELGCYVYENQSYFHEFMIESKFHEMMEGFRSLNRKQRFELSLEYRTRQLKEHICLLFEVKLNMSNAIIRGTYRNLTTEAETIFNAVLRENYRTCKKEKTCKFCTAIDGYGNVWKACENESAAMNCPSHYGDRYGGNPRREYIDFASWYCPEGYLGVFQGETPDYSKCDTLDDQLWYPPQSEVLEVSDAKMFLDHLKQITNVNQSKTKQFQYFGHEISRRSQDALTVVRSIDSTANFTEVQDLTHDGLTVIASLLANKEQWKQLPTNERLVVATSVLNDLDSTAIVLAKKNKNFKDSVTPLNDAMENHDPGMKIVVGSEVLKPLQDKTLFCSDKKTGHESSISIKISGKVLNKSGDGQLVEFVGSMIQLEYIEHILQVPVISPIGNGTETPLEDDSKKMNGKMISFNITGLQSLKFEEESVHIEFAHNVPAIGETKQTFRRRLHPGEIGKAVLGDAKCAFWDKIRLRWSTEGCRRVPSKSDIFATTCVCNHLTSFSVLMGFHEYAGKDRHLQIISWVLCPISIICLGMTIVVFSSIKLIRTEQTKITTNLCATLILGNFLLLLGDKDNFYMSEATCTTFGVFSHYAWLCAFGWMAVEGIHLYQQVVKVFHSGRDDLLKLYSLGAYGIPVIIVGLTLAIGFSVEKKSVYSGELFCWLRGHYIWAFMLPVIIVLIVWINACSACGTNLGRKSLTTDGNLMVLVKAVSIANGRRKDKMVQKAIQHEQQRKANKKLIKGTISLSMLLGLTWFVGFFTMVDFPASNVLAYVFTIFNASQGIFIFIFHCCMNKTIRSHLSKAISQRIPSITWSSQSTNSTEGSSQNQSKSKAQETIDISKS